MPHDLHLAAPDGGRLVLVALPAVAAGFFVLSISDVSRNLWLVQGASVALMFALASSLPRLKGPPDRTTLMRFACGGVVLCAVPMTGDGSGPERWLAIGPVSLYIAPVVVPTVLAVAAHTSRGGDRWMRFSALLLQALAFVLACQPDLSQVVALTAAGATLYALRCRSWTRRVLFLLPLVIASGIAAMHDDPLRPVSYVEHVLAVSWRHSLPAGIGVSVAALVFVVVSARRLAVIDRSLLAVSVYYALLFVCSMRGWTPAPVIGYGAGPILGFGLLAGLVTLLYRGEPTAASTG